MSRLLQLIYDRLNTTERWMALGFMGLLLLGSIASSCRNREPKHPSLLFPSKLAPKSESAADED
jgi:hypothetical protein